MIEDPHATGRWDQPVFTHDDPETFQAAPSLSDGIHTILADGSALDLLIRAVPGALSALVARPEAWAGLVRDGELGDLVAAAFNKG
ncbi:MAG: hypothetical protein V4653_04725 [Pseudomonadota bacterium]